MGADIKQTDKKRTPAFLIVLLLAVALFMGFMAFGAQMILSGYVPDGVGPEELDALRSKQKMLFPLHFAAMLGSCGFAAHAIITNIMLSKQTQASA